MKGASPFGQELRRWRAERRVSQLDLALSASTTARYISFIETGRSRPGREVVLRIAEALDVPLRGRNALLRAAGLRPEFSEHGMADAEMEPVRRVVRQVLANHAPYPALALGPGFTILEMNEPAERVFDGIRDMSPPEIAARWFPDQPFLEADPSLPLHTPVLQVGDQKLRTITTVMRFDRARDVTASELVVELMFPADAEADAFFRSLLEPVAP